MNLIEKLQKRREYKEKLEREKYTKDSINGLLDLFDDFYKIREKKW